MPKHKLKILVAMSGGVDSSVTAQILKNKGHDVTGVFLDFWKDESAPSSQASFEDAKAVAGKIGIEIYNLDFTGPFKREVVDYFLSEYESGRTPNPCVVCNRQVKLGRLLEYAKTSGYDAVATGHYLKLKKCSGQYRLYRANDPKKDQTYFLYTFGQDELSKLLFPLGKYSKPMVRKMAEKFGLPVYQKAESQDICFLSGPHNDFLKKHLELIPGDIIEEESGQIVGQHQGLPLYTIGQRRGIEIGGTGPYYVSDFDCAKNILYVTKEWNDKVLYRDELMAENVNWISGRWPKNPVSCGAVIRYGHPAQKAKVYLDKDKKTARVVFKEEQRAITSGQSVVFYKGKRMLGGGVISVL